MKNGIKLVDNSSNEYQLGGVLKELISEHVSDDIIKQFISLANQHRPEEKAPFSKILQIFA